MKDTAARAKWCMLQTNSCSTKSAHSLQCHPIVITYPCKTPGGAQAGTRTVVQQTLLPNQNMHALDVPKLKVSMAHPTLTLTERNAPATCVLTESNPAQGCRHHKNRGYPTTASTAQQSLPQADAAPAVQATRPLAQPRGLCCLCGLQETMLQTRTLVMGQQTCCGSPDKQPCSASTPDS